MADTDGLEWVEATEPRSLASSTFSGVAAVVHLAGRAHVTKNESGTALSAFRVVNRDLALAIARSASEAGVRRFVFVSTIGVLGRTTDSASFDALTPPAPGEPYEIGRAHV